MKIETMYEPNQYIYPIEKGDKLIPGDDCKHCAGKGTVPYTLITEDSKNRATCPFCKGRGHLMIPAADVWQVRASQKITEVNICSYIGGMCIEYTTDQPIRGYTTDDDAYEVFGEDDVFTVIEEAIEECDKRNEETRPKKGPWVAIFSGTTLKIFQAHDHEAISDFCGGSLNKELEAGTELGAYKKLLARMHEDTRGAFHYLDAAIKSEFRDNMSLVGKRIKELEGDSNESED